MAVRGHIPLDMYPSLDRGTGHINSTALVASVLNMQNKIATLEDSLLAAGIADGGDSQSFIGHRLALVEQEVSELHEVETNVLLPMDAAWVISCATLVFLMQLGFAQLEAGMCRPKNVIATYLKNIADFVLGSMCTLFVGFAIAYDQVPLFDKIDAWQFFFHLVFQATASTIVSGAMAERINIKGYCLLTTLLSGFIYAFSVQWTWGGGLLMKLDPPFFDFAGSGVVHLLGGSAALAGTIVLGPRKGRWEHPEKFSMHSVPSVLSGALLLWVGWYGFNCGSTGSMSTVQDAEYAANAAMTTTISAATAGCWALLSDLYTSNGEHVDVMKFVNSVLAGLVAITAGASVVTPWMAILTGLVACAVLQGAHHMVLSAKIDDVVDASSVHGACGAWGCIAVGLFHPIQGLFFGGGPWLLITQIISVFALASLGFFPVYAITHTLNCFGVLRSSEEEEDMGIDLFLFKVAAYVHTDDDGPLMGKVGNGKSDGGGVSRQNGGIPSSNPPNAVGAKFKNAPSLPAMVDQLRNELNLPKDISMATAISQACVELELELDGITTTMAKAHACWRVLSGQVDSSPVAAPPGVDLGDLGSAAPVRLPLPSSTAVPATTTLAAAGDKGGLLLTPSSFTSSLDASQHSQASYCSTGSSPGTKTREKTKGGGFFSSNKSSSPSKKHLEVSLE